MLFDSAAANASASVSETLSLGSGSANVPGSVAANLAFASGTGAGQVDLHWEKVAVTLAAGASATYTLSALVDSLLRTVAFAKVRALVVSVTSRTALDYLTVGDPTGALTHLWSAPFGAANGSAKVFGFLALGVDSTDGYPVAAGSADQLLVTNSGTHPIVFSVGILGTSL